MIDEAIEWDQFINGRALITLSDLCKDEPQTPFVEECVVNRHHEETLQKDPALDLRHGTTNRRLSALLLRSR